MDPLRPFQPLPQSRASSGPAARFSQDQPEREPEKDGYTASSLAGEEISREEEESEGERHERELLAEHGAWAGGRDLLDECQRRLAHTMGRDDLVYRFEALETARPLASSCPNGMVYFSRGMLENLSLEQICFFGAHEIAHTELRHFATRRRRLGDLQQAIPAQPGSALRMRVDQAAVLAVRHEEEFEADHQAGLWLSFPLAVDSLSRLFGLCQRLCPEMLTVPSHPPFPERIARCPEGPPDPVAYCYALLR